MTNHPGEAIFQEYITWKSKHGEFGRELENIVSKLLKAKKVRVHSVTHRLKEEHSLRRKVMGGKYQNLAEVTDICGVRIITFFADEVDKVAEIIESEFEIDTANSVDKRAALDPDRFGYLSRHYVVSLSRNRSALAEYAAFKECKAEIQIRSILQHTWAEIEHDLGYKSSIEVPKDMRRQFSMLAGLLELADQQFAVLRDRLVEYETKASETIEFQPEALLLDRVTLKTLIEFDSDINELDAIAVQGLGSLPMVTMNTDERFESLLRSATLLELRTVADVKELIRSNASTLRRFIGEIVKTGGRASVVRGAALWWAFLWLALERRGRDGVKWLLGENVSPEDYPLSTQIEAYYNAKSAI